MQKILLFGASIGGQNLMKNHVNEYEYVAIIDNDITKQGMLLNDIPIIHPNDISNYQYDKIIVASMYVDSIRKQLTELQVPMEKVTFASKNSMKVEDLPFENPEVLQKTNDLIILISKILDEVPHYYTFGTLLGIVREGSLIPWDDDIDIAIFVEDAMKVQNILAENVHILEQYFDVKLYTRIYSTGSIASITLDCIKNGRKLFMINFDCMHVENDMVKQELNDTPIKYFEGYEELPFNGGFIRVPSDYKGYLTYTYGDWHIVKKNTSFTNNTISFREPLYSCSIKYLYESK